MPLTLPVMRRVGDPSSSRGDFMDIKEPIVLLVGKNMSGALRLVEWLRRLGCGSYRPEGVARQFVLLPGGRG